jgi:hypothetical protein
MMLGRRVLFIGDHRHHEFGHALVWLSERCDLAVAPCIDAACAQLRASEAAPEVIVVGHVRPGCLSQLQIESLHRAAPLARLIALLGSWCEGEARSGRPWSGVVRVYWHEFVSRMENELPRLDVCDGSWVLPRTATDAERLAFGCLPISPARPGGLIAISAGGFVVYEGLADACSQAGYATAWFDAGRAGRLAGAIGGLWDDSSAVAGRPLDLASFVKQVHPAAVIALVNFPRREDFRRAAGAGAAAVCAKPFLVGDLLANLERVIRVRAVGRPAASAA